MIQKTLYSMKPKQSMKMMIAMAESLNHHYW